MPDVLNMRRVGYRPDAACIDRSTPYGNPFIIGVHGTRDEVCDKHLEWAREKAAANPKWLEYLRGKDLLCHCAPKRCHGTNYLILLEETAR
jgi:hypothetical protein